MKRQIKNFLSFIFRVDIFNRILVFISMAVFLVLPSYILYNTKEFIDYSYIVVPCLLLIADVVGNGLLTLYRPIRQSWFYFLVTLFILCFYGERFTKISYVDFGSINVTAIIGLEIGYCLIAVVINLIFFIRSLMKKKRYKTELKEGTNADSYFDFLNGVEINREISDRMEDIPAKKSRLWTDFAKNVKLSRFMRGLTLGVFIAMSIYYLVAMGAKGAILQKEMYYSLVSGLIVLPICFVSSILFPRDFKYTFYYNAAMYEVISLLLVSEVSLSPAICIISLIVLFLSLLITMIVEGRAWMGADSE